MKGPFSRLTKSPGFLRNQTWYTQERPYKRPLPYALHHAVITADFLTPKRDAQVLQQIAELDKVRCISRCYDKLKSNLGDSAQLGASIAEWRSTANSITSNCLQLLELARAVKSGNVRGIKKALRGRRKAKSRGRGASGEIANRWLEYSFGWKPLIEDIYNGISVLQNPAPKGQIKGSATTVRQERFSVGRERYVVSRRVSVRQKATVVVSNPNLYIANQMGLVDPIKIAWELVPWSFVVDWFTNLGQVLGTMSDFAGVTLTNAFTTTFATTVTNYSYVSGSGVLQDSYTGECVNVERVLGITGPSLIVRPFNGFSVTRGANAIALLVQQLVR